ncbi:hypothetical protein PUR71_11680 [Streptomyces sp. SP17BM10]|uniref:hypothetical protein n=1 Tax=Streptomyces sp. SP17BM10 TaxID=3002530 RepID=UPI002E772AB8|nr:hypothetical protein [Streptomyces sp. SP17BM10]MEE1783562.1 hypothetical protein [Streptomyces sp. SP17BM10]
MNMSSPPARPPGTALADGAPTGGSGTGAGTVTPSVGGPARGAAEAGTPEPGASDGGTDGGRVDGTAQEPSDSAVCSAEWDLLTDGVRWDAETFLLLGCDPGHGPLSLDRLPDRLPEADRPLLRRMMTDTLVHGRTTCATLRVRRSDGTHDGVECAGEPVLGPDGTVTALRMLLRPAARAGAGEHR